MKFRLYAVFDRKANVFARPFTSPNDAMAARSFLAARQDPATEIHKFPDDFQLYCLGEFDDDTGVIAGLHPAVVTLEAL